MSTAAGVSPETLKSISTPDQVESRLGTLKFDDGAPSEETAALLYDNQTRSLLQTDQRYPRAGSQQYPSPAAEAEADGSTVVYVSPAQPDGVAAGNWIQSDPEKGWFVILRLYSPLQAFFDKTWRPGEFEVVT